ncbi:MAG: hypothetical protein ACOY93_07190 [Bacillota bacterium]
MLHTYAPEPVTHEVFTDPVVQLAALCPICALAAYSPSAALAALSPVLNIFNPAVNPRAALLAFALSQPQAVFAAQAQARAHRRFQQLLTKHRLRHPGLFGPPLTVAL